MNNHSQYQDVILTTFHRKYAPQSNLFEIPEKENGCYVLTVTLGKRGFLVSEGILLQNNSNVGLSG